MKARKKKAAKRAAKRTTEITEKVAANAEDKKAEVVDSPEKTAAAQDTTKKEVKAEPAKEEKKPEVKAEPVKEEKKTERQILMHQIILQLIQLIERQHGLVRLVFHILVIM